MRHYLYGHTSPETAYVVDGYPYGFHQKTQIRFWIESKKGKGQRFVYQTKNPKNGLWNPPKPNVYHLIIVMCLDENGHMQHEELNGYSRLETIENFKEMHLEHLDDFQKQSLKELLALKRVMQGVKVTCEIIEPGEKTRDDWKEDHKRAVQGINRAIALEMKRIEL